MTLDAAEVGQGDPASTPRRATLAIGANRIDELDANASIADALGLPLIDGQLSGQGDRRSAASR